MVAPKPLSSELRRTSHDGATRAQQRGFADRAQELEDQNAALGLQLLESERERRAELTVTEPVTYSRDSGESYFYDQLRLKSGRGDVQGAAKRLATHDREMRALLPRWIERRQRAAAEAYERAVTRDRAEARQLERMEGLGLPRFLKSRSSAAETRGLSRTDGQAGYLVPPLYLLEEWVPAPRAGRPFADLWPTLPLMPGTDSINIPRMVTGTASGPQADTGPAASADPSDAAANATVCTIAGSADVSMQWAEMTAPPGADQFVFKDLMADIDSNTDAQLILGNGGIQLNGAWPGGTLSQANHVYNANTNNADTSAQSWTNGGTGSSYDTAGCFYASVARMLSVMNRARGLPPTHVLLAPWLWWYLAGDFDAQGRPLVAPHPYCPAGKPPAGAAGMAWSLPCILDDNVPVTWGGAPPDIGISQYVSAPIAGSGSYTPVLAVRSPDLLLLEGDVHTRVLQEVVSGAGMWRFQAYRYVASTPSRYTAKAAISVSTSYDGGGVHAGGSTITGAASQYETNGVTSLGNFGG